MFHISDNIDDVQTNRRDSWRHLQSIDLDCHKFSLASQMPPKCLFFFLYGLATNQHKVDELQLLELCILSSVMKGLCQEQTKEELVSHSTQNTNIESNPNPINDMEYEEKHAERIMKHVTRYVKID